MRIAVFSPYGNSEGVDRTSSNFIFLLASYLKYHKAEVLALKCDGCLENCTLDLLIQDPQQRRRPCVTCMRSQNNLSDWSHLTTSNFSDYLQSDDLKKINQSYSDYNFLVSNLPTGGNELFQSYLATFAECNLQIAKLQKSCLGLAFGIRKFLAVHKPKLLLTHSKEDLLTGIVRLCFIEQGISVATYKSQNLEDELTVTSTKEKENLKFRFYSQSIENFRSDPSTWDEQLRDTIIQNVNYLGLQSNQLSFQI